MLLVNKRLVRYCLIFFSTLLIISNAYSSASKYKIKGISGELYDNVDKRLQLLDKQDNLAPFERSHILKQNIVKALQPYGYYTPSIQIQGNTIIIEKGLAVTIHQINLTILGAGKPIYSKLPKKLPIEVGKIFNSEQYEDAKQQLFDIAEQHGYLNSKMITSQASVNIFSHQATIAIIFDTGQQYHFGQASFSDKTYYAKDFLARYLNFKPGMPYSTEKIMKLNEELNSSGYFSQVAVKPTINSHPTVPVHIHLRDRPAQNYTAGLGFGTDTGPRGRLGWQWRRVTPNGHTFKAMLQGSQRQSALQAQYMIPGNDPVADQYTISANIFQLTYPVGTSRAKLFNVAKVHHEDNKQYTISLNALQEVYTYTDNTSLKQHVIYPEAKFTIKKVSSPLFSKNGFVFDTKLQASHKSIGSELSFQQGQIGAKWAVWLPTQTRLFLRGDVGITNVGNISSLPLSLQLLAGGSNSVRGYHFQSIGPGKRLLVGSMEVQQSFKENWFITAFYDIGDAFNPTKLDWHRGVGGGMMWVSPVGPLRLSLAKALDDPGEPFRLIMSMGSDL